jgi:hypothetical protein
MSTLLAICIWIFEVKRYSLQSYLCRFHRMMVVSNSSILSESFLPCEDGIFALIIILFYLSQIWIRPECPRVLAPVLGQLRFVNLDSLPEECDITWTMFLLEAAPSVEDLCITVCDHKCGSE